MSIIDRLRQNEQIVKEREAGNNYRSRVEVMQDIEMVMKKLEKNNCNMVDNVLNSGTG